MSHKKERNKGRVRNVQYIDRTYGTAIKELMAHKDDDNVKVFMQDVNNYTDLVRKLDKRWR